MKPKAKTNLPLEVFGFSIFGLVNSLIVTLVSRSRNLDLVVAFLRVCPETSGRIAEFSEHEAD